MKYLLPSLLSLSVLTLCVVLVSTGTIVEVRNAPLRSVVRSPVEQRGIEMTGVVTAYSDLDSCHNPVDGGCLVASGKIAQIGMIACPRKYKFGTVLRIENEIFTCEDRLAKRFDDRVDIFMGYGREAHKNAVKFGKQRLKIAEVK